MIRFATCLVSFLAFLSLAACAGGGVYWRQFDVPVMPFEDVWNAVIQVGQTDGFVKDEGGSDRGLRRYRSRWIDHSGLGFRRSSRQRLHAEIEPALPKGWRIRIRVQRQNVPDMAKSFRPNEEDWSDNGQNASMEERIRAQLRLKLGMQLVAPSRTGG